jgi:hypothetical protein
VLVSTEVSSFLRTVAVSINCCRLPSRDRISTYLVFSRLLDGCFLIEKSARFLQNSVGSLALTVRQTLPCGRCVPLCIPNTYMCLLYLGKLNDVTDGNIQLSLSVYYNQLGFQSVTLCIVFVLIIVQYS